MEPPWILVLCHEFPPLGGGAGKNLFLLCRELTRRGVKVRVWTEDPGVRKRRHFDFDVEYMAVGRKQRFETSLKGMAAFCARACLRSLRMRGGRPALVLSVLGIPSGLAGVFIARRVGAPHAVWYHGSDIHAGRREGPGGFQRFLLRLIWKGAAVNFFVSTGLRDMAAAIGKGGLRRVALLPACPSPEILAYPAAASAAIKAGGAGTPEDRCFLFLGRLDPVKHPLLALQAIELLKTRGQVTHKFRMAGSGALAPEVQKFVRVKALSGLVALEGAASYDRVPELLRSAYALIVPSRIEGFNTTILEAAHFGVPAVASDTQGIRDFVKHGETGLLFKENDAEGLAEALRALAADPSLRDALGERARAAALPYRPERVADAFLAGIADVAPGFGAPAMDIRTREGATWN